MENCNYYVYIYLDPRKSGKFIYDEYEFDNEPIYIGKGTRNRINHHINNINNIKTKKSLFYSKLNKIIENGYIPIKLKIKDDLNEINSLELEKKLISLIGRIDLETGPLCNMTEGGEKGFSRTLESREKLRQSKLGDKNPMYGKTTSNKQKESISKLHENGLIKLTYNGRQKIIENGQARLGKKNSIIRSDIKKYFLISPDNKKYEIFGAKALQNFCKMNKLQYHVLKLNLNIVIEGKHIIGKKINAKNTIGWKNIMN